MRRAALSLESLGPLAGSKVILTSRFEATRELFWTDLVISSCGMMTPELAPPSPNFQDTPASPPSCYQFLHQVRWAGTEMVLCTTPAGGRLVTTHDLTCYRLHIRRIFSGIMF
ncbi:hypothetical protein AVEN_261418-1 [Araneus ventricosus]|uniref:Uncharacterized protein n=1 Tax=Araneus ventricosus TaxID=182803 RepID=A0A4Y2TU42_ARAVE|nr:hypothetical protein AVEN_261418-1 [Araneus ventricosus]